VNGPPFPADQDLLTEAAILLEKTVGLEPAFCSMTDSIDVVSGNANRHNLGNDNQDGYLESL
jgi:hypothetical protein